MSYEGLGISIDNLGTTIDAVSKVVEDPALPEVACNILRLNEATEGKQVSPPCVRRSYSAAQRRQGVGLYMAVVPLRAATWARQHPITAVAVGIGVVGGLIGLGYYLGRR